MKGVASVAHKHTVSHTQSHSSTKEQIHECSKSNIPIDKLIHTPLTIPKLTHTSTHNIEREKERKFN